MFWEEERYPGEKELPKPYPDRLSELQRLIYTKKKNCENWRVLRKRHNCRAPSEPEITPCSLCP